MTLEAIDRLKQDLTDRYVTVTGGRPELARFEGVVGQVKTVNMSGRALVEFSGYHNNPAWHDIDPACLRVVEKPAEPEPAAKRAPAKPTKAPAKPSAADKPKAQTTEKKRTSPSVGKSTVDILAAARGGAAKKPSADKASGADSKTKKQSPSVGLSTADVLAAARGKKPAAPAESHKKKPVATKASGMTTEEILAAARAAKKPAAEAPKASALDDLTSSDPVSSQRKILTAEDIRNIGLGKLSLRREQHVATEPREKPQRPEAGDAKPECLPDKVDHTEMTAADILAMGQRR